MNADTKAGHLDDIENWETAAGLLANADVLQRVAPGGTRTSPLVLVQFAVAASMAAARDLMTLVLEEAVPAPKRAVTAAATMTKTAAAFMCDSGWNLESRPAPSGQWFALGG